jgi:phage tail sheath protein FI
VDAASGDGFAASHGTASANATHYFPRVRQPHTLRGGLGTFAASGAVAGVIARSDATEGVWSAPAGLDAQLRGVSGFDVALAEPDLSRLNVLGVNALRDVPSAGPVVWGARTLQGADAAASEWKYVPVRRTALFLEESIERGLAWTVFEPNDEPLWASVRATVETFMSELFSGGAFHGHTADEAYFVRCGRDTTTEADIDAGRFTVEVGFAPLRPAEFVTLRIRGEALSR